VTVLPLLGDADNWAALPLTENMDMVVSSAKGLPGIELFTSTNQLLAPSPRLCAWAGSS
jgi:hypothetical protein